MVKAIYIFYRPHHIYARCELLVTGRNMSNQTHSKTKLVKFCNSSLRNGTASIPEDI
jgi:hypothetical protein